jgi:hypothetical protein
MCFEVAVKTLFLWGGSSQVSLSSVSLFLCLLNEI